MKAIQFFVFFFILVFTVQSENYYISSQGNDSNSGTSNLVAWKSITKLNSSILQPGDSVLFRRGDTFNGEIVVRQSGTPKKPIVFSAYGNGLMPVITGAVKLTNSIKSDNQKSLFPINKKVLKLYINNIKQPWARYPNVGYLTMGNGIDRIGFETTLTDPEGYWAGATIRMRTIDWTYEFREIASFTDGKLKFTKPSIYNISKGYGYYLEGKKEHVDAEGEWYSNDNELQVFSNRKLNEQIIEGVIYQNGFVLLSGVKDIVITRLKIDKYAENGIWAKEGSNRIQVKNNEIKHIGHIAIWLDTLVSKSIINSNLIEDIDGRGISGIRNTDCIIKSNTIRRIGLDPGHGISGVNGMEAIVIENEETNQSLTTANRNLISYNEVDSCGYAGIRMDGHNSICEFNIVRNTSLKLNDSGAIYCYGSVKNRTKNNIIRKNLIINSVGNNEATPGNGLAANGIYLDNNSTEILVEKNTIIGVSSGGGLTVNDNAPSNILKNNTLINCGVGIGFAEWGELDSLYGCFVKKNIVVATEKHHNGISLLNFLGPDLKPGDFFENTYINYNDGLVISKSTKFKEGMHYKKYTLKDWQNEANQEKGSISLQRKEVRVIYNDSFKTKKMELPIGKFAKLNGTKLGKTIQLKACSSQIIAEVE